MPRNRYAHALGLPGHSRAAGGKPVSQAGDRKFFGKLAHFRAPRYDSVVALPVDSSFNRRRGRESVAGAGRFRSWLLVALALFLEPRSGHADATLSAGPLPPTVRMDGSRLQVLRVPTINHVQTGVLIMDGRPFRIVERDTPTECGVPINSRHEPLEQLLSHECLFGPRCLGFEGRVAPTGCGPDRIEVDLASDEHSLRFGQTGYFRFFFRVDPALVGLNEHSLISQVWQFASVAIGPRPAIGPAFSIAITSDPDDSDRVIMQFRYRNTVSARDRATIFFEYPIKKGEWRSFHLELTPRYIGHPQGPGSILIWADRGLDGARLEPELALNYRKNDPSSYNFYWGYPPDPSTRLTEAFEVRVGIYRPEPLTSIKYWMDGIKFTRRREDIAGP
jgi:hypothetical protein